MLLILFTYTGSIGPAGLLTISMEIDLTVPAAHTDSLPLTQSLNPYCVFMAKLLNF